MTDVPEPDELAVPAAPPAPPGPPVEPMPEDAADEMVAPPTVPVPLAIEDVATEELPVAPAPVAEVSTGALVSGPLEHAWNTSSSAAVDGVINVVVRLKICLLVVAEAVG
jgi:hypothetical protein